MLATTTVKWKATEIKNELLCLLGPGARIQRRMFSENVRSGKARRLTWQVFCQDTEQVRYAGRRLEQLVNIQQVRVTQISNLEYCYVRVFLNNEHFQKRGI